MKLGNAKQAVILQTKHEKLCAHQKEMATVETADLPTDQQEKYNNYMIELGKQIKKTEKEITDL